ncbi:putative tyramine receptor 2 [Dendronephthya gigantea]|uniref:putative tyramine receptor 2 n=1 Tax=Dendronephthya gigantea TaxID=151771 RepID=UPI00106A4E01|nr:putative tyramine receptor 2 [Dendronephthya gigantea]
MTVYPGNSSADFNGPDYGQVTATSVLRTIPMIMVSIASFIGNALVLLAIYRFKNLRTFSNMYIGSLAITDIIASLAMPFSYITVLTNGRWLFGEAMCLINGFLLTFLASASLLTLLVFSMYRCYLITTIRKRLSAVLLGKMIKISVLGIWLLALIYSSPPLFGGGKIKLMRFNYSCIIDFVHSGFYIEFLVIFLFIIPLIVMTVAYARIIKFINMHNKTIKKNSANTRRRHSGIFAQSSEASVDEGNRYTVMELKRKLDLMNEGRSDAQKKLQNQLKNVLAQSKNGESSQSMDSDSKHPQEIPLTNIKPSQLNTEVTFQLSSSHTMDTIVSCPQDEADEPTNNDDGISEDERSCDSTSENTNTKEVRKKISVSSVVQKWKNRVNKQDFLRQYRKRITHQTRLARILLVTVVTFLVCWTPFSVDSFLLGVGYTKERPKDFQLVAHWLAFSNALCNPIIYTVMNAHFKGAFKTILQDFWRTLANCCIRGGDDDVFQ